MSIDSPDPKVADLLTGCKGYFSEIAETIRLLVENGIEVQTNTVITSYNVCQIPDLIDFLTRLGVRDLCLTPYSRSLGRHKDALFAPREALERLIGLIQHYQRETEQIVVRYAGDLFTKLERPKREVFAQRLFCTAGRLGLVILPNGKVTICERLAKCPEAIVGDLREQSLAEVWNSHPVKELVYPPRDKYQGTICYSCPEYDECTNARGRCFVRSYLTYDTLFGPDPLCPQSPQSSRRLI